MEVLKNKKYAKFDYTSRYISRPYYYHSLEDREFFGIGKNLSKDTAWVAHKVEQADNLDALALKYYNNPTFWWIIAYLMIYRTRLSSCQTDSIY